MAYSRSQSLLYSSPRYRVISNPTERFRFSTISTHYNSTRTNTADSFACLFSPVGPRSHLACPLVWCADCIHRSLALWICGRNQHFFEQDVTMHLAVCGSCYLCLAHWVCLRVYSTNIAESDIIAEKIWFCVLRLHLNWFMSFPMPLSQNNSSHF